MKEQTKIIVGILAGIAVIGAVGLLMNSDKGTEVREEISDYFADLVKTIKNKAQTTANNIVEQKDGFIKNARSIIHKKVDVAADAVLSEN